MTQPDTEPTAEQIERAVEALHTAHRHLAELNGTEGGFDALSNTSRGTAALRDLRTEIDRLYRLLPMKG